MGRQNVHFPYLDPDICENEKQRELYTQTFTLIISPDFLILNHQREMKADIYKGVNTLPCCEREDKAPVGHRKHLHLGLIQNEHLDSVHTPNIHGLCPGPLL